VRLPPRAPVRLFLAAGFASIAVSVAAQPPQGSPPMPPARKIPGITAPDTHPAGCVDCHINYVDMKLDARFSTLMKGWTAGVPPVLVSHAKNAAPAGLAISGKHPAIPAGSFKNIPGSCMACHGKASKLAPPFARMIHGIHLTGGDQNPFLTMFQGECTLCHKLNATSGSWTIPSGPEK
jgi:hypothetical protein